ncbi:MAG TPA: Fe-S-containing protein [Blastocatellia bacterium]|nr:Fe-S-containing protein [Blastocatellia bacterium]
MFESMVVTLREGVEAALIVAIVLGYLKKIGRLDLARSVYAGLAAGVLVSLAGALVFRKLEIDEDRFEGWMMLAGALFVATMVVWMWRTAGRLKGEIESRIANAATASGTGFSFGIIAFVFLMVTREGIETVLFLGAVQFNTTAMMNFIGGVAGLGLAVAFGVLFVKGSIRINLRKFFSITSAILLIVAFQLFVSGLHELSEAMILPSSAREMAMIGPIVKNDAFFYVIVLALTALMIIWQRQRTADIPADVNPAERRKMIFRARRERLWTRSLGILAVLSMVMITGQFVYSASSIPSNPPEQVFEHGKEARIAISKVDDGKLHLFAYDASGKTVRFLIMKLASGKMGVAFDACQICGDKGYYQDGQQIICKNCVAAINPASIGQGGGCNPIELSSKVESQEVIIQASDLDDGARFFTPSPTQK